jgi:transcriptional regulator with XRE-family HTH domain
MIDRINLILKAKNLSAKQFAEEIGIQPSGMSHILSGRNNPSLDFVMKVMKRYPEIDINWLMSGKGEMYVFGTPSAKSVHVNDNQTLSHGNSITQDDSRTSLYNNVGEKSGMSNPFNGRGGKSMSQVQSSQQSVNLTLFDNIEDEPVKKTPDANSSSSSQSQNSYQTNNPNIGTGPAMQNKGYVNEGMIAPNDVRKNIVEQEPNVSEGTRMVAAEGNGVREVGGQTTYAGAEFNDGALDRKERRTINEIIHSVDLNQEGQASENRLYVGNGLSEVLERTQKVKKMVKIVVLYDDHSFSEYYPE